MKERPTSGELGPLVGDCPLLIGFQLQPDMKNFREQFAGFMDDIHVTVG